MESSIDKGNKIILKGCELFDLLREAYMAGQANHEMQEAGLERDERDNYAEWIMCNLEKRMYYD